MWDVLGGHDRGYVNLRPAFSESSLHKTSGKLLTKAYGIVHNVGLLRVSVTFSVINDKQK